MSDSVHNINNIKSGTCPHGCAPGACPICSGMGGSGMRPGERAQKPGEMSYHECAMIGAMMRAQKLQAKMHEESLKLHAERIKEFESNMAQLTAKMAEFAEKISKNFLLKPVSFAINKIAIPILNIIRNIPQAFQNIAQKFIQIKADIQDKLNAIFGEAKAFLEKKVSEILSVFKKRLKNIFRVFKRNRTDEEETKIDEDKKIFRLKTIIKKLLGKKSDDTKNNSGS